MARHFRSLPFLNLGVPHGVLVVEIVRGSPAHLGGLKGGRREVIVGGMRLLLGGDIITHIDDHKISGMKQMVRLLDKMRPDQRVILRIFRNGQPMRLNVLLTERP